METTPEPLVACPYCGVQVSEHRIERHKKARCPKAPPEVIAARPPPVTRPSRWTIVWSDDSHEPDPPRPRTTPTPQDRQINTEATTTRMEDGSFYVRNVLSSGGSWTHHLSTDCPYCHHTLPVLANAPSAMPEFAKEEACRLALLCHLRTDHASKQRGRAT